jgi:hypothetical protein
MGLPIQYTTLQWPRCNDMAKKVVKTLKHGLIIFFTTTKHAQDWDEQFPCILFGINVVYMLALSSHLT